MSAVNDNNSAPAELLRVCDTSQDLVPICDTTYTTRYTIGLSEIGAEGQKFQKSKLVTFF